MKKISPEAFLETIEADPALRAQLQACHDQRAVLETVKRLADECGCVLAEPLPTKMEALPDDALETVAGGVNPFLEQGDRELNPFSWFVTIMRILEGKDWYLQR